MIIKIGTEVDESRIMWKYSEEDTWKSVDIDELMDDLKREIDELKRENHFLKDVQKYIITNGTDCYVPPACRGCSNHPSNGGSGICNCTLGGYTIT